MATEKKLNARIVHKHDTEEHWLEAENFKPLKGEIIIYDADNEHENIRVKIGDGERTVKWLPFITIGNDSDIEISSEKIIHGDAKELLSTIIDTYVLKINYNEILAFDTSELVIGGGATSPILGIGMLGYMVLA